MWGYVFASSIAAETTMSIGGGELFAAGGVIATVLVAILRVFHGEAPVHRAVKILEAQRDEAERQEAIAKDELRRWRKHSLANEQLAWRWEQRARVWHLRALEHGWPNKDDTVFSPVPEEATVHNPGVDWYNPDA